MLGALIKDVEDYLDTKCNDICAKGNDPMTPRKTASLERLMNRAFTQALFQGRQDVSFYRHTYQHIFREEKLCGILP